MELLRPIIRPVLDVAATSATPTDMSIATACLHVGCGLSDLGDYLRREFPRTVNLDFSPACIEFQRNRDPEGEYVVADASDLSRFPSCSFGCILDKGTLDAMLQTSSPSTEASASRFCAEVVRLLAVGGVAAFVSIIKPEVRLPFFQRALPSTAAVLVAEGAAPSPVMVHTWNVRPLEVPLQREMWVYEFVLAL